MDKLDNLIQERETLTSKLYKVLIQVVFIMVVPALFSVLFGNFLKDNYNTHSGLTFLLVASSVTLSFMYVFKVYKALDIKMVKLDNDIKDLRTKLGVPTKKYPKQEDMDTKER